MLQKQCFRTFNQLLYKSHNIPLCMRDLDTHSRTTEENPIARVQMPPKDTWHLLQRPSH